MATWSNTNKNTTIFSNKSKNSSVFLGELKSGSPYQYNMSGLTYNATTDILSGAKVYYNFIGTGASWSKQNKN
jgi:hypothetical protein